MNAKDFKYGKAYGHRLWVSSKNKKQRTFDRQRVSNHESKPLERRLRNQNTKTPVSYHSHPSSPSPYPSSNLPPHPHPSIPSITPITTSTHTPRTPNTATLRRSSGRRRRRRRGQVTMNTTPRTNTAILRRDMDFRAAGHETVRVQSTNKPIFRCGGGGSGHSRGNADAVVPVRGDSRSRSVGARVGGLRRGRGRGKGRRKSRMLAVRSTDAAILRR